MKTSITHHLINDFAADGNLLSNRRPILLLYDEERAVRISLTISKIHPKIPDILGAWNKSTAYVSFVDYQRVENSIQSLHVPVHE